MNRLINKFNGDRRNKIVIGFTFFFSILAHSYRWMNPIFSHDSLLIEQIDTGWQISLGRFLIPVYVMIRGEILMPLIIGLLSVLFLTGALLLLIHILDLRDTFAIISICGIFSTFSVVTILNASCLHCLDIYMLSLFCAVAGVWFFIHDQKILSVFCFFISLGIYQIFIQVGAALFLLWIIKESADVKDSKILINRFIGISLIILSAGGLYCIGCLLACSIYDVPFAKTYNSVFSLMSFDTGKVFKWIFETYKFVAENLLIPDTYRPKISGPCNLLIGILSIFPLLSIMQKVKRRFLFLLLLIFMPIGSNFVYILSQGHVYSYMVYPTVMYYVIVWFLFESDKCHDSNRIIMWSKKIVSILIFIIIANNTLFANQVYVKKSLEESATLSAMTRIVAQMESTEGYIPGKTKVVLLGDINYSTISSKKNSLDTLSVSRESLGMNYSVTYYGAYDNYFRYILGYNVNLAPQNLADLYIDNREVLNMPAFPVEGFCKMVDDVLLVKLSENMYLFKNMDYYSNK